MTRRIYKKTVPVISSMGYMLRLTGPIVHVGQQSNPEELVIWYVDNPDATPVQRTFAVVGTGQDWPEITQRPMDPGTFTLQTEQWVHLATVQAYHGLVWHLLERISA